MYFTYFPNFDYWFCSYIWDFLLFLRIFLSPQVKRIVIITNKHGIYELPHELSNDSWPLLPHFDSPLEDFWHEPLRDIVVHVY